MIKRYYSILIK